MVFTKIMPEQRGRVEHIRRKYGHTLSAWHAFHTLFLWQDALQLSIYLTDDLYVVKYGKQGERCWFMPCGAPSQICAFLEKLRQGGNFRLFYLRREDIRLLVQSFPHPLQFRYDRNSSEYLYDINAGCRLDGKAYQNLRHKLQRIRNRHEISAVPLSGSNIPIAERIVRLWLAQKNEPTTADNEIAHRFFMNMQVLSARGTVIFLDGVPAAVAAGIPLSGTVFDFCIHKQATTERGLNPLAYHTLMEQLQGQYTILNAEEDMGLPGLRTNKQEMQPYGMNHMWEALYEQV